MKIDFHSHILPGIDDGSRSVAESIEMLQMEASQGVDYVVATPHFYANSDRPDRFLRRRKEAELRLREEMQKHPDLPKIGTGAEVFYFRGISESEIVSDLTIENKSYILLEMPDVPWTDSMFDEIEQIYFKQGITPVIAHIDRYICLFRTHGIPERLSQMPVLVQANAEFFLRFWTKSMALQMLHRKQIHLLGSDCHNLSNRSPNLDSAYRVIEKRLGSGFVDYIDQCGAHVLFDECFEV